MSQISGYTAQDSGHLGLAAGMCRELKMAETVDHLLPAAEKHVSHGNAVCAMILNGLGFVSQQLYLVPDFFRNKPVERLPGEGITADQLNDDTLGRTSDAVYDADPAEICASAAAESCRIPGAGFRFAHMDSTGFHTDGQYDNDRLPHEGVIRITEGYSRDHRPELSQCVLNLISESRDPIPVHMNAAGGNSGDRNGFRTLLSRHADGLQIVHEFRYAAADSALYTEETLRGLSENPMFISRMPAALTVTKDLLNKTDITLMHQTDENCSCQEVCGIYAGVGQRRITVHSRQGYERDIRSLNRRALKGSESEMKAFAGLCRRPFACRKDAEKEREKFEKTLRYACVRDLRIREEARYEKRGKPENGELPDRTGYLLTGGAASCLHKRMGMVRTQGMSVPATNELDEKRLPAPDVLTGYKGQSHAEKGFRFLKNPEFPANSLFLKKPERITALLRVMTVCLMVYAAPEYRIRQGLQQQGHTVTDQVGKPADSPTARWIFHCFTGIHILYHNGQVTGIMNLNMEHWKIINLPGYQSYYS